jgi:hypothetical protein
VVRRSFATFQAGDAMFVNFGYVQEPTDSFHDLANEVVALPVSRSIFRGHLPVFRITICRISAAINSTVCAKRFVAFRQTLQSLV